MLGFEHPEFHGEIIAELERRKESDTVRVLGALAVHKDADGEIEVAHLSNLCKDEAIEFGSKVGALVGLGIEGEKGPQAGAEAGEDGMGVFSDADEWDVIEEIPKRLGRGARRHRASPSGAVARRDRPRRRLSHQRRLHQSARLRRDRTRSSEEARELHGIERPQTA